MNRVCKLEVYTSGYGGRFCQKKAHQRGQEARSLGNQNKQPELLPVRAGENSASVTDGK